MPNINLKEVKSIIRKILQGESGRVLPTPYCRKRMLERQVFMEDISHVLFWGEVESGTHEGDAEENIFRVIGQDLEDEPLTLVIRIILVKDIIEIITVFGEIHGRT
jgi:hypothetical protein